MYTLQASLLLKDVVCPYCKDEMRVGLGSPFRVFNPLELNNNCDKKKCMGFLELLNTHFQSLEKGRITEDEFTTWLDQFRRKE